jgi:type III secretion protein U
MSEKTEAATPKKIEDSRKKGQVAKSEEVTLCVKLATVYAFFSWMLADTVSRVQALLLLSLGAIARPFPLAFTEISHAAMSVLINTLAPLAGALVVLIVLSNIAQTGPMIAVEALEINLSKFDPVSNLKNVFSTDQLVNGAKSLAVVSVVGILVYSSIRDNLTSLQALSLCGVTCGVQFLATVCKRILVSLLVFSTMLGAVDFLYRKYKTSEDQKMTKDEVKRERKDNDGDPNIKSKRRELAQEAQSGNLAQTVKRSTAVVTNPTHIAVCIYYNKGETVVPRILAKGADHRAHHIIRLAEMSGVPIVQNIALARSLNKVSVNRHIPVELYVPVAQLLALLDSLRKQAADDAAAGGVDSTLKQGDGNEPPADPGTPMP